jgi:hypothetical protein
MEMGQLAKKGVQREMDGWQVTCQTPELSVRREKFHI